MTLTTGKPPAIHLGQSDPDGQVVVHEGNDLFLLTVQEAVNACGAWHQLAEFQSQMRELIRHLVLWVSNRKETVRDAYLSVKPGGGLLFLVVMKNRKFDSDLEDALTTLDVEIANASEYCLLRVSVLAIPNLHNEGVESFLTNS